MKTSTNSVQSSNTTPKRKRVSSFVGGGMLCVSRTFSDTHSLARRAFTVWGVRVAGSGMCLPLHAQDKSDKSDEKDKKKDKPEIVAIVGGNIHTVTGPVVRNGTILIEDGKIKEIGQSVEVPEDAKVIDAAGKTVTPGFVAITMSRVGIGQTPTGKEKLVDGLNPFDRNLKYALGRWNHIWMHRAFHRRSDVVVAAPRDLLLKCILVWKSRVEEYVTESMMDYGDLNTSLCPCCGLPVLPTEPITATPPVRTKATERWRHSS